jgi:hypothetical protein
MYIFVNNLNVAAKKSLPKIIFLVVYDSSLKEPSSERILLLLFVSLQWWCGVIILCLALKCSLIQCNLITKSIQLSFVNTFYDKKRISLENLVNKH